MTETFTTPNENKYLCPPGDFYVNYSQSRDLSPISIPVFLISCIKGLSELQSCVDKVFIEAGNDDELTSSNPSIPPRGIELFIISYFT